MPAICRRMVSSRGRAPQLRSRAHVWSGTQSGLIQTIEQMQTGKPRGFNEIAFLFVIADNERKGGEIGGLVSCLYSSGLAVSRINYIRKTIIT